MIPENFDDTMTCKDPNEWKAAMNRNTVHWEQGLLR